MRLAQAPAGWPASLCADRPCAALASRSQVDFGEDAGVALDVSKKLLCLYDKFDVTSGADTSPKAEILTPGLIAACMQTICPCGSKLMFRIRDAGAEEDLWHIRTPEVCCSLALCGCNCSVRPAGKPRLPSGILCRSCPRQPRISLPLPRSAVQLLPHREHSSIAGPPLKCVMAMSSPSRRGGGDSLARRRQRCAPARAPRSRAALLSFSRRSPRSAPSQ